MTLNSQRKKLILLVLFLTVVLAGGYWFSLKINRNKVKKTGFKTEFNPSYIDSMVQAKKKK